MCCFLLASFSTYHLTYSSIEVSYDALPLDKPLGKSFPSGRQRVWPHPNQQQNCFYYHEWVFFSRSNAAAEAIGSRHSSRISCMQASNAEVRPSLSISSACEEIDDHQAMEPGLLTLQSFPQVLTRRIGPNFEIVLSACQVGEGAARGALDQHVGQLEAVLYHQVVCSRPYDARTMNFCIWRDTMSRITWKLSAVGQAGLDPAGGGKPPPNCSAPVNNQVPHRKFSDFDVLRRVARSYLVQLGRSMYWYDRRHRASATAGPMLLTGIVICTAACQPYDYFFSFHLASCWLRRKENLANA